MLVQMCRLHIQEDVCELPVVETNVHRTEEKTVHRPLHQGPESKCGKRNSKAGTRSHL